MWQAFKLLAKLKGLRGTAFDVFGYTAERRSERKLSAHYQKMVSKLCADLTAENCPQALLLANLPEKVRGFGHVKEQAMRTYYEQVAVLKQR